MNDDILTQSTGPDTDVMQEAAGTTPIEVKPPPNDPEPEEKPKPTRQEAVRKAIEDTLGKDDKADEKAEADDEGKKNEKAEGDDKASEKAAPPDDEDAPGDDADKPKVKTAFRDPPARFDDTAKSEWATVPESVRGNIHRMQRELEAGIEKHRAAAQEYEPLRQYVEIAKRSGTTLDAALENYIGIERMLRANPIAAIEQIVGNLGLKHSDGRAIGFKDIAEAYLRRSPDANRANSLQAQMAMMQEQQRRLTAAQEQQRQEQYQANLVAQAKAEMPRFDELRPVMLGLVQSGEIARGASDIATIQAAYAEAERRFPKADHTGDDRAHTPQQPSRQPNPAGQLGVRGGPPGKAKPEKRNLSRAEAIEKAMRAAGM